MAKSVSVAEENKDFCQENGKSRKISLAKEKINLVLLENYNTKSHAGYRDPLIVYPYTMRLCT